MQIFVDFDGTICPNSGDAPQKECIEVLRKLKQHNHIIVIFSCRSNPECVTDADISTKEMVEYLHEHGVPFDLVQWGKPYFNYIIDDRAIGVPLTSKHDVDWSKIKDIIDI